MIDWVIGNTQQMKQSRRGFASKLPVGTLISMLIKCMIPWFDRYPPRHSSLLCLDKITMYWMFVNLWFLSTFHFWVGALFLSGLVLGLLGSFGFPGLLSWVLGLDFRVCFAGFWVTYGLSHGFVLLCLFNVRSQGILETNITKHPFFRRIVFVYITLMTFQLSFTGMNLWIQENSIGQKFCISRHGCHYLEPAAIFIHIHIKWNVHDGSS